MKLEIAAGALVGLLIVGATVFIMSKSDESRESGTYEFSTREMTKEELVTLWQRLKDEDKISWSTADFLGHNDNYVLHKGDLTITKDFNLFSGQALIVDGDLLVEGSYDDHGTGHLVVLGDMKSTNFLSDGTSVVTGKVIVDELVYCYYNDYISEFRGGVESRALFIYDKSCSYPESKSKFEFFAADTYGDTDYEMYRHLSPELAAASVKNPAVPDYPVASRIIGDGGSVFRVKPAGEGFLDAWRRILEEFDGYEEFDFDDLAEMASIDETFRIIIARREDIDPTIQALLIESSEIAVLKTLARNQATTSAHLTQISDLAPAARPMMVENPNAPSKLVATLVADPDPAVRIAIAQRNDINAALAMTLAADANPDVRHRLTQNGSVHQLGEVALMALANDADTMVVRSLLNSDAPLPVQAYQALTEHQDSDVRTALAEALRRQTLWQNRQTLPVDIRNEIAEGLLLDGEAGVHIRAVSALGPDRQLEIGTDWLSRNTEDPRRQYWPMALAKVTTSPALMLKLAEAENLRIRESLAENLALSPEAQHRLLDPLDALISETKVIPEKMEEIVSELAQNDNVVDDVLLRIARLIAKTGTNTRFSTTILHHKNLPANVLTLLWSLDAGEDFREDVAYSAIYGPRSPRTLIGPALNLRYDADHGVEENEDKEENFVSRALKLMSVKSNGGLLAEFRALDQLAGNAFWEGMASAQNIELRIIAAGNYETPFDLILKLATDEEREVSRGALDHPKMPVDHPLILAAFDGEEMPGLSNPRLSDEFLLARADRFKKRGRNYDADKLFKMLSRRKLRAGQE